MADPEKSKDDDKAPGAGDDDLPTDAEELKKLLIEQRRKLGQMENDRARERKARQAVTERAKVWLDLEEKGHTPEEIQRVLDQRSEAELAKARDTGDVEKLVANARKQAEKERDEERSKRTKAESLVQRVMVDDVVKRELGKYVEQEFLQPVFAWLRPKFVAVEDPDDEYGIRPVVNMGGEHMPAGDWIKQWVETDDDAAPFLKRSLATGGGASGGGRFKTQLYRSELSPAEKSRIIRQQGLAAYNALPMKRGDEKKGAA